MKQLKTNLIDLRRVFDEITVKYITEFELKTAKINENSSVVKKRMIKYDFDIMPLISNNKIIGYIKQSDLTKGVCSKFIKKINPEDILAESTPILEVLLLFKNRDWLFVKSGNEIKGIVTRGDLRKAPVRMFLFLIVNLLEMHITRLIRKYCKQEDLCTYIGDRLKKAEEFLAERKRKNEALDIFDSLQFCDKRDIALEINKILNVIKIQSKTQTKTYLKKIINLRDRLAHGHDIVSGSSWIEVIDLSEVIEEMIERCEEIV